MTADLLWRIIEELRDKPELRPLYEALTVECPDCKERSQIDSDTWNARLRLHVRCEDTDHVPTGRVSHDWDALPDGALEGVVRRHLPEGWGLDVWKDGEGFTASISCLVKSGLIHHKRGSTANAVVLAVLADWLDTKADEPQPLRNPSPMEVAEMTDEEYEEWFRLTIADARYMPKKVSKKRERGKEGTGSAEKV